MTFQHTLHDTFIDRIQFFPLWAISFLLASDWTRPLLEKREHATILLLHIKLQEDNSWNFVILYILSLSRSQFISSCSHWSSLKLPRCDPHTLFKIIVFHLVLQPQRMSQSTKETIKKTQQNDDNNNNKILLWALKSLGLFLLVAANLLTGNYNRAVLHPDMARDSIMESSLEKPISLVNSGTCFEVKTNAGCHKWLLARMLCVCRYNSWTADKRRHCLLVFPVNNTLCQWKFI